MSSKIQSDQGISKAKDYMGWVMIVIPAFIGIALVLFQTRYGPGTGGDSTSYLMGAENILAGNGFSRFSGGYEIRPISGFPPFYSIMLAGVHSLVSSLMASARWLNGVLFSLNILLVGALVWRRSGSIFAGAIASLLFLTSDQIFLWHTWVMSEPLFIFLMLLGLWLFLAHFRKSNRFLVFLAGVIFALATLTRYAGISLFAAGAFVLIFVDRKIWRTRLIDLGVFLAAGVGIIGAWMIRNTRMAGTTVNREIILHSVDPELLRLYLAEASSWFMPHEIPLPTMFRAIFAIALLLLILGWFFRWAAREKVLSWPSIRIETKAARCGALPWFLLVLMVAYIGVLAINSLLLDASTSPSAVPRYLVPLHTTLIIFSVAEVARLMGAKERHALEYSLVIYAIALIVMYGSNSTAMIKQPLRYLGYTGDRIQWSELVTSLEAVGAERPILSNNPELVYILAGRPAYVRPIRYDHYQEQLRQDYLEQLKEAEERLDQGGVLVIFKPVEPVDEGVVKYAGLNKIQEYDQAVIYAGQDTLP